MNDFVELIKAIVQLVIAFGVIYGIYVSRGNRSAIKEVHEAAKVTDEKVTLVAKQTDGITEALVDANIKVARSEGRDEQRDKQEAKEATQAISIPSDEPLGKPIGVIRKK